MMAAGEALLLTCSSSLLILLSLQYFFQSSLAAANPYCPPSACGNITNIHFPFRLNDDPTHCGHRRAELACENNVTSIYLNSHKYYVKDIDYSFYTIRVVDASINNDDTCSFPTFSTIPPADPPFNYFYDETIYFISCPLPLNNNSSSLFTDITHHCPSSTSNFNFNSNSNSNSSSHRPTRYTYIMVLDRSMKASEVPETCRVEVIVGTSWSEFKDLKNVSLSEIHQSLLYGLELWLFIENDDHRWTTWEKLASKLAILFDRRFIGGTLIILPIVALLSAVITPLVIILIGFAVALGFSLRFAIPHIPSYEYINVPIYSTIPSLIMICAPRFIICPFVVWLLIHKFRRRHWSSFEGIESFLQSDNKLTPIRYSYSDIKKITRGFRDKLGEGGFGCVYKGKLRSGNDVAVKLLGKSGASGQDFMNEIATIGRIHHVNIVKLVGYCAQGSKRALVYDFMPNSSLEKYLFNREKMNSLNWDTKFEIAIGVARGIEYLHQGCDIQILHFDIKPHNILLDDKFIPKISDFGLAKFCATDKKTVTMTAARGTIGYVAPELISRSIGAISYKADVYSFGMLLMELVGLNRDLKGNNDDSGPYFPYWIYDHINQGKYIEIGKGEGNNDDENDSMRKLGRKMTIVALWCIQMNPDDRPSMNKVLRMLEADVERLKIPDYPSQSIQIVVNMDDQSGITCTTDSVPFQQHDDASSCFQITVQD